MFFLERELEKGNNQSKFENRSRILDDILNNQRSRNWVLIKRSLKKDLTLHLNKLIKIQKVMQLPFKPLSKRKKAK
jgi:hypothetical protein